MTQSAESVEDALQLLGDSVRRFELLEEEARDLNLQLSIMMKACDTAFAESNSRQREMKAQEARLSLRGDE